MQSLNRGQSCRGAYRRWKKALLPRQNGHRRLSSHGTCRIILLRISLLLVSILSILIRNTKCQRRTDGSLCVTKSASPRTRKQTSRRITENVKKLAKNEHVTENDFGGINRDKHVNTTSHQQTNFTIDTTSSSELPKMKRNENSWAIPPDALHAKELKQKEALNDVALFTSRSCKCKMTVGLEPTVMDPVIPISDMELAPNLNSTAIINLKSSSCLKNRDTPRLRIASKQ